MENCPSDHPAGGRETSGPAGMDEAGLRSKVAEEIAQEIEGTYARSAHVPKEGECGAGNMPDDSDAPCSSCGEDFTISGWRPKPVKQRTLDEKETETGENMESLPQLKELLEDEPRLARALKHVGAFLAEPVRVSLEEAGLLDGDYPSDPEAEEAVAWMTPEERAGVEQWVTATPSNSPFQHRRPSAELARPSRCKRLESGQQRGASPRRMQLRRVETLLQPGAVDVAALCIHVRRRGCQRADEGHRVGRKARCGVGEAGMVRNTALRTGAGGCLKVDSGVTACGVGEASGAKFGAGVVARTTPASRRAVLATVRRSRREQHGPP
jgi:hypothetical protein